MQIATAALDWLLCGFKSWMEMIEVVQMNSLG
jgi:hypothetical protein